MPTSVSSATLVTRRQPSGHNYGEVGIRNNPVGGYAEKFNETHGRLHHRRRMTSLRRTLSATALDYTGVHDVEQSR